MCTEVRIVDDEDAMCPWERWGDRHQGSHGHEGILPEPEETAQTCGGMAAHGDLGKYDEDGFLYFVDRKKDMIKTGGLNVYSKEVEEVLARHPRIAEAVIIGVPDEKWERRSKRWSSSGRGDADRDRGDRFLQGHLASYKKPTSVAFVPPSQDSVRGKVLKRELRERFSKKTEKI